MSQRMKACTPGSSDPSLATFWKTKTTVGGIKPTQVGLKRLCEEESVLLLEQQGSCDGGLLELDPSRCPTHHLLRRHDGADEDSSGDQSDGQIFAGWIPAEREETFHVGTNRLNVCGRQRSNTDRFFRMTIPRIMLAISDPWEGVSHISWSDSGQREGGSRRERKAEKVLRIWRSCVRAWRCWSWGSSCWSRWRRRTSSPWSHSFWRKKDVRICLGQRFHGERSLEVCYLMGIAVFFLPKFDSKMKPSIAMNRNWVKVTMLPHPGNSLQQKQMLKKFSKRVKQ